MPIVLEIGMWQGGPEAYAWPRSWSPPLTDLAKSIPGIHWDKPSKRWLGWPDAIATLCEQAQVDPPLAMVIGTITTPDDIVKDITLNGKGELLREYQREGVRFVSYMAPNGGVLLADDVGLGKTVQTLLATRDMIERKAVAPLAVVICPAVVKPVWRKECEKWCDDFFEPIILHGTKTYKRERKTSKVPLLILNYDIIHAWAEPLSRKTVGVLVVDECHLLMTERSRRSKNTKRVSAVAQAVAALSATPMLVRPRDLWNILDTLTSSRFGRNPWPFYRRYCDLKKVAVAKDVVIWDSSGSSNEGELAFRLSWLMLRRAKADVMSELPERTRQCIDVKVSGDAVCPIWSAGWERSPGEALRTALTLAGTGKIDAAAELASSRHAEGHCVVVFTHLRNTAKKARRKIAGVIGGLNTFLITGEDPVQNRTEIIEHLRKKATPSVLVATIDSIGVGIDLSFIDIVVFIDLDWVPSKLLQAEGRTHRMGQKNPVIVYYLIATGTADEYIREKVIERLTLYEKLIGNADEAAELVSDLRDKEEKSEEAVLAELRQMFLEREEEEEELQ